MITKLHHVAVATRNIDDAIRCYVEFLGCETPRIVQRDEPGARFRTAVLPIGKNKESFLQLVEPSGGPELDELERGGEGTILHVGFEVDNIEEFYDQMMSRGIEPVDVAGQKFSGKCAISLFGNKYFFLPKMQTRGTRTEIAQIDRVDRY